jgi:hypothetical protein
MFGNTFANLDNEITFVRDSLSCFAEGDLLLLAVPLACAPADDPAEILKKDPRLSGRLPSSLRGIQSNYDRWLKSLFVGNIPGVKEEDIDLTTALDTTSCVIRGSYAAEVRALVRIGRSREKEFSVLRIKRYDRKKMIEAIEPQGWDHVDSSVYAEEHHPRLLVLFRKRARPPRRVVTSR